jgi:hypothetical protein
VGEHPTHMTIRAVAIPDCDYVVCVFPDGHWTVWQVHGPIGATFPNHQQVAEALAREFRDVVARLTETNQT